MRVPRVLQSGSVGMNMTPMIDVVFLLIIFFLISSHLAKREHHAKLSLPEAQTGIPDELVQRQTVTINVFPDGTWQLAGQSLSLDQLATALASRNKDAGGLLRVRIRTDRTAQYAVVAPILKACVQAKTTDVVFGVFESKSPN